MVVIISKPPCDLFLRVVEGSHDRHSAYFLVHCKSNLLRENMWSYGTCAIPILIDIYGRLASQLHGYHMMVKRKLRKKQHEPKLLCTSMFDIHSFDMFGGEVGRHAHV